jgi:hypothetical protein
MLQNTTYIQILIGVLLLIIGAIFAGIGTLIRDFYRFKKEKLSTAYAFKGEINALLDIIGNRKYISLLKEMIKSKTSALDELKDVYKNEDIRQALVVKYTIEPLLSFSFQVNEDVFFVKNKLGDKIGLLDSATTTVISFYGYANSFLLDINNNMKKNDEYEKFINNDNNTLDEIIDKLNNFYKIHSIPYMVRSNIEYHKNMLEIAERIIKTGNESIKELDKFILKHKIRNIKN